MSLVAGVRWSFRDKDAGSARTCKVRAQLRTPLSGRAAQLSGSDDVSPSPATRVARVSIAHWDEAEKHPRSNKVAFRGIKLIGASIASTISTASRKTDRPAWTRLFGPTRQGPAANLPPARTLIGSGARVSDETVSKA